MKKNDEWTMPCVRIERPYIQDARIVRDVHAPGWAIATPAGPLVVAALHEDRTNTTNALHDLVRKHVEETKAYRPTQILIGALVATRFRRWLPNGRLSMTTERLTLDYGVHGLRLRTWHEALCRAMMDAPALERFLHERNRTAGTERELAPWVSELIERFDDENATASQTNG